MLIHSGKSSIYRSKTKRNQLFFSRFPSCCVCYQQKSFNYDFELLRNDPSNSTTPLKKREKLEVANPRENIIPRTKIKEKLTNPQSKYGYRGRSKLLSAERTDPWKWKRLNSNLLNSMFMNFGKQDSELLKICQYCIISSVKVGSSFRYICPTQEENGISCVIGTIKRVMRSVK